MTDTAPAIESKDTVFVAGTRGKWIVETVNADGTFDVTRTRRIDRRTERTEHIYRVFARRVTLVRKGNALDEAVDKFIAEYDARKAAEAEAREAAAAAEAEMAAAREAAYEAALAENGGDVLAALLDSIG
jgi:hypothetical protein